MVLETFPNGVLDEEFEQRLEYKIPQSDIKSLAACFGMLENGKFSGYSRLIIYRFSFSNVGQFSTI